jgi:hypothetical protein
MQNSKLLLLSVVVTFAACAAPAPQMSPLDQLSADSQMRLAQLDQQSEQRNRELQQEQENQRREHVASREAFNGQLGRYDHPGPECSRYLAFSTEARVALIKEVHAAFNRIYGSVHARNNNKVAAAAVAYGGIVGLGAAMNANDEEQNLYLSLGEQLDQLEGDPHHTHTASLSIPMDLAHPVVLQDSALPGVSDPCVLGTAHYSFEEDEALCSALMGRTSPARYIKDVTLRHPEEDKINDAFQTAIERCIRAP